MSGLLPFLGCSLLLTRYNAGLVMFTTMDRYMCRRAAVTPALIWPRATLPALVLVGLIMQTRLMLDMQPSLCVLSPFTLTTVKCMRLSLLILPWVTVSVFLRVVLVRLDSLRSTSGRTLTGLLVAVLRVTTVVSRPSQARCKVAVVLVRGPEVPGAWSLIGLVLIVLSIRVCCRVRPHRRSLYELSVVVTMSLGWNCTSPFTLLDMLSMAMSCMSLVLLATIRRKLWFRSRNVPTTLMRPCSVTLGL